MSGLNNEILFSHGSGGRKSEVKVLPGLVSGLETLPSCSVLTEPFCEKRDRQTDRQTDRQRGLCVSSFSHKDASPMGLGPFSYVIQEMWV